jgi:hypothetical protein
MSSPCSAARGTGEGAPVRSSGESGPRCVVYNWLVEIGDIPCPRTLCQKPGAATTRGQTKHGGTHATAHATATRIRKQAPPAWKRCPHAIVPSLIALLGELGAPRAWRMAPQGGNSRRTANLAQVTCPSHRAIRWPRKNPTRRVVQRASPPAVLLLPRASTREHHRARTRERARRVRAPTTGGGGLTKGVFGLSF